MHDQAVERIAHTNTPGLGIEHDIGTFSPVTCGIEIGMANTGPRFNHRNTGVISHIVDQTFAAARDQQINIADGTEQCSGGRTVCRQQSYRMLIHSVCLQHFPDHLHDRFIRIAGVVAAFQHTGISGFQTQGHDIETDVRTGFIDHADHSEWNRYFCNLHSIGANHFIQYMPQWRR